MSDQVARKLWQALDVLRGDFDLTTAFNVVASFLMLKFASDRPALVRVRPAAHWDSLVHSDSPVEAINQALSTLKAENPDSLGSSNSVLQLPNGFSPETAARLLGLCNQLDLTPSALKYDQEVGQVFDQLQRRFSDAQGKGGGDFANLPPFLSELMARLAGPSPGQSVYDPFARSGDLLIAIRGYIDDRHGADTTIDLVGQTWNATLCDRAKVNLLFHGISDFFVRSESSLYDPLLNRKGEWRRFDRLITAPPFAMKYDQQDVAAPERMQYGWPSERGNNADLMMLQHVLASLNPEGIGVVLIPQGVLFRGGLEGKIRQGIIEDDRIEAVIGLGPNILPATSVPVSIMIVRGPRERPLSGMSEILFVEAGRDLSTARGKHQFEAEVVEKIVTSVQERVAMPGFSRGVLLEEIAANQFNLNIPTYINRTSVPPVDVQTIMFGGIPRAEVEVQIPRFNAFGVELSDLFEVSRTGRLAPLPEGVDATVERIDLLALQAEKRFAQQCRVAWKTVSGAFKEILLSEGVRTPFLNLMDELKDRFLDKASSSSVLDSHELRGVWATWMSTHESDLRYLREHGYDVSFSPHALDFDITVGLDAQIGLAEERALASLGDALCSAATLRATIKRRDLSRLLRLWANEFGNSLKDLEVERTLRAAALDAKLRNLGYI